MSLLEWTGNERGSAQRDGQVWTAENAGGNDHAVVDVLRRELGDYLDRSSEIVIGGAPSNTRRPATMTRSRVTTSGNFTS